MKPLLFISIICCMVGCGRTPVAPLPTVTPKQGTVSINSESLNTGAELVVTGSFVIESAGPKSLPVVAKVRRADGRIMTSSSGMAQVDGTSATFEIQMKAPEKPGNYRLVASSGNQEISATDVSITAK